MAQDAIRGRMNELWSKAREELLGVMDRAEAGDIISGTEWEVRRVYQQLARDCFQLMVQSKVEKLDQTPGGAFSPCGVAAGPAGPEEGGPASAPGRHRQR
jgi:hypothetical protein